MTTTTRRSGKARRRLAFTPFHNESCHPGAKELEQVLVFALQELMELFGGKRYVDLCTVAETKDRAICDENDDGLTLYQDLASQSGAGLLMTGRFDAAKDRHPRGPIDFEIRVLVVDTLEEILYQRFTVALGTESVGEGAADDPLGQVSGSAKFQEIVRNVFDSVRRIARWRYSGDPEDRAYFEFRLDHGLSPSFEALRYFVRARRFSTGPEKKLFYYKRCLSYDPCLGAAQRNIAFLYKEQKKYNLALRFYQDAAANLIDRATLSETYSEMGLCYANSGHLDKALSCWHKARHWDPRDTDVYANLGIGYEEKGVLDKAIRYFSQAQNLDPDYYWACRGLGRIYCNQGKWKEAIDQLHRQIAIAPKDAWGHYALGSCYAREGDFELAREHLRRALELDPDGDAGRKAFQGLMQIDV